MDGRPTLSLVLPAFNEAAGIARAVAEADEALARLLGADYEVLVVDDGSRDDTAAAAEAAAAGRPRVRVLRHPANRGYGAALRTGFEAAAGSFVAFTDADCQFDLADLGRLLDLARTRPIAAGWRVDRKDPWLRCFLSRGYNVLARALLGTRVRDVDCALKVFRREALAKILPETNGFFVNTEMFARARQVGLGVAEAGVAHRPRLAGASKVSLWDVPKTLAALLPFWWSRVLWGGPTTAPAAAHQPGGVLATVAVLGLALVVFFCRLNCPLLEPEEARYAEIPRQMLADGRWLVPAVHGQAYLDKPPLSYWLVMGSYRLLGVEDESARLVPALASWLTVCVVWLWARRTVGPRAALAAAAVLCLAPEFVYRGRMLTPNAVLALCTTASLAACHLATAGRRLRRGWWYASAVVAGLGVLTKGPIALALVVPPLVAFRLLDTRLARVPGRHLLGWPVAAALVAGPWFVAVAVVEPGFARYFLWTHHVERFVDSIDHSEPVWFYLPALFVGLLPWSLLLPGLGWLLHRRKLKYVRRRPAAMGLGLMAATWGLVFFSLADCKRTIYLLPVFPPLALAIGCALDALVPREKLAGAVGMLWRWRSALAHRVTAGVLAVSLAACVVGLAWGLYRPERLVPAAAVAAAGLFVVLVWRRGTWALAGAVTCCAILTATHELLPAYHRRFSLRHSVLEEQTRMRADGGPEPAVMCYPRRWDSVSFYLQRDDVTVFDRGSRAAMTEALKAGGRTVMFVKTRHLEEVEEAVPAGMELVPRRRDPWVTVAEVRPVGGRPVARTLAALPPEGD